MALTEEQQKELLTLHKLSRQYEGIIRTTRNPEQLQRAKIELKKIRDKMEAIAPGGTAEKILQSLAQSQSTASRRRTLEDLGQYYPTLAQMPMARISPNSDELEINILGSVLNAWENTFYPALTKIKLDFALSAERDSHFTILEGLKRQMKILCETIEDFPKAVREDSKAQLKEMRIRQQRQFLFDGGNFLKKLYEFWKAIYEDIQANGPKCFNKDDHIQIDTRLESSNYFQGKSVRETARFTVMFLHEAIQALNLPELPTDKNRPLRRE
ncbi:MAG: hypothetical protein NZL89_04085 [Leptospiraceae bacterium]|nr:hypothetical protein [Leptospiraceae bacterium]